MARTGGRNTVFAWLVGVVCTGIVVALAVIALPLIPHASGWVAEGLGQLTGTSDGSSSAQDDRRPATPPVGATGACRDLYPDPLWTSLRMAGEADMTTTVDPPEIAGLPEGLSLQPSVTCVWRSDEGTITTTVATAPTDTASLVQPILVAEGFACATVADRVRCTRAGEETLESVEIGGGIWLSSVQEKWRPASYATRVADRVWG